MPQTREERNARRRERRFDLKVMHKRVDHADGLHALYYDGECVDCIALLTKVKRESDNKLHELGTPGTNMFGLKGCHNCGNMTRYILADAPRTIVCDDCNTTQPLDSELDGNGEKS